MTAWGSTFEFYTSGRAGGGLRASGSSS